MSRAPSRRALLAMAGGAAAVAMPSAVVIATPPPAPTAPDPVIAIWRELQRAMLVHSRLSAKKEILYARRDEMTDGLRPGEGATQTEWSAYCQAVETAGEACGYHAAWARWNEAFEAAKVPLRRLIATRPTTARGVLAKVAAAKQLMEDDEGPTAGKVLASLLVIDPTTLTRG